jgi:hypothetical protein
MFKRFCLLQVFNYSRVQDFKDIKGILMDANNCEQVTKTVDKNQRPKPCLTKWKTNCDTSEIPSEQPSVWKQIFGNKLRCLQGKGV